MTKAPNPNTRPRSAIFPLVSNNELPPLGFPALGVGVAADPLVGLAEPDESAVVGAAAVLEPGLVAVDEDWTALELETTLPACITTPPWTFPVAEVVVPCAAFLYAVRVSPVLGGLTTPAMPP